MCISRSLWTRRRTKDGSFSLWIEYYHLCAPRKCLLASSLSSAMGSSSRSLSSLSLPSLSRPIELKVCRHYRPPPPHHYCRALCSAILHRFNLSSTSCFSSIFSAYLLIFIFYFFAFFLPTASPLLQLHSRYVLDGLALVFSISTFAFSIGRSHTHLSRLISSFYSHPSSSPLVAMLFVSYAYDGEDIGLHISWLYPGLDILKTVPCAFSPFLFFPHPFSFGVFSLPSSPCFIDRTTVSAVIVHLYLRPIQSCKLSELLV